MNRIEEEVEEIRMRHEEEATRETIALAKKEFPLGTRIVRDLEGKGTELVVTGHEARALGVHVVFSYQGTIGLPLFMLSEKE
jgi:hypothetical protein